jgi:hypothetical protein
MDLITAKQAVRDVFPQFANKTFILWQPQGILGNVFKVQEYIQTGRKRELFGNEYYVDLDLKDITQ